ncbi:MAG: M14 family zinc carboxypeptidase [bacterium]
MIKTILFALIFATYPLGAYAIDLSDPFAQECSHPARAQFFKGSLVASSVSDPAYHTPEEIAFRLKELQDSIRATGNNWLRVDTLGYSQQDRMPIFVVKIARNVDDTTRDRPAVVFVGQNHAEEILGVELVMRMIPTILNNRRWRDRLDIYIIPTLNPEGLSVVYTLDYTYRKNKRDNIGDGLFRYVRGWGQDTSGVDLNRNYPLFWHHGSGFLVRGDNEFYDYYRGPGPASESETRAFIRFMDRVRPLYSVVYHSSRTGNVAEQVIYPWSYAPRDPIDKKVAPDQPALDFLASEVASRCRRYGQQDRTYEPVRIMLPRGDCESYLYRQFGTYAFRIEIGAEGEAMQPDSIGMYQVLNDVRLGMEYLLNSAANISQDLKGSVFRGRLDIKVTSDDGKPLRAHLYIPSLSTPLFPYRWTNPISGRYYWLVPQGFSDSLTIRAYGYEPRTMRVIGSGDPSPVNIRLTPLPLYHLRVVPMLNGDTLRGEKVEMEIFHPDSHWTVSTSNGLMELDLPKGDWRFILLSGLKVVPFHFRWYLESDTTLFIQLTPATALLYQNFDGSTVIYTSDHIKNTEGTDSLGHWETTDEVYLTSPRALTDSRLRNTIRNDDSWAAPYNMLTDHFDLSSCSTAALVYWLNQALEPGYDSMWVEWSRGGVLGTEPSQWEWFSLGQSHQELSELDSVPLRPWNSAPVRLQKWGKWKRFVIPLDSLCGEPIFHFRFHLKTDGYQEEDGVYIDEVALLASSSLSPRISSSPPLPTRLELTALYPNPFNNWLTVIFKLPNNDRSLITLTDTQGRVVFQLSWNEFTSGQNRVVIPTNHLPSGVYFVTLMSSTQQSSVKKAVLMK